MTLTISPNAFIAQALGSILVLVGLVFAILSTRYRGWAVIGALMIGIGGLFVVGGAGIDGPDGPNPPAPTPPGPSPPAPVTSFQQAVKSSWKGTPEEARHLANAFAGYAFGLGFDGTRPAPRINTVEAFGRELQEAQRYYMGSEAPFGPQPATALVIEQELRNQGVTNTAGPLDAQKRAKAVGVLVEASAALEAVK